MAENTDFISPHQCLIIYDKENKKFAASIRNRMSAKDVKCTIWDKDTFEANEKRLSNYNRMLILNSKIEEDYLINPEKVEMITDYVVYRREGRIASLNLLEGKDFAKLYDTVEEALSVAQYSDLDKESLMKASMSEIISSAMEGKAIVARTNSRGSKPYSIKDLIEGDGNGLKEWFSKRATPAAGLEFGATLLATPGGALTGGVAALVSLGVVYTSEWYKGKKAADKCKIMLWLEAADIFENKFLDDFLNAK